MSDPKPSKGWLGSKRRVLCGYCNIESRFDNLKRHTLVHGKDLPLKYTPIESTESVKSFLITKSQNNNNNNLNKNESQNEQVSGLEDQGDGIVQGSSGEGGEAVVDSFNLEMIDCGKVGETEGITEYMDEGGDNSENEEGVESRRKRICVSPPCSPSSSKTRKIEITEERLDKKFQDFGEMLVTKVNERIEVLMGNKKTETVQIDDLGKSKETEKIEALMNSKDLEGAETCLQSLDFGKIGETDEDITFYCKICLENNPPPVSDSNVVAGCITLDLKAYSDQKFLKPEQQPRVLRSLKNNIKRHILENQSHKHKVEEKLKREKSQLNKESRNKKIGLNLFRIRYTGIKQHQPRTAFEESILTAQLNGVDVGDINHSRKFAKEIDRCLFETMKEDLKKALQTELEATGEKRPIGLTFDKMTPAKETGQVHALVIPVPENPLSQPLIVPVFLDLPPVQQHDIASLAKLSKSALEKFGVEDKQVEGIAVDGEYVKKGIKDKIIAELDISDMDPTELGEWITVIWDPAHELELAVKDVRKEDIFEWMENYIKQINEATELLNISKGLQQSLQAAEDLEEKLYKLRNISGTRFVAYFYDCLANNEKSLAISIEVLKEKSESSSKKETREKAGRILKSWKTQLWMMTNLGLMDVFRQLGEASRKLQTVELFPWEVLDIQSGLIRILRDMAEIKLTNDAGDTFEEGFNKELWSELSVNVEKILKGEYRGQETEVFQMFRRGRSSDSIKQSGLSLLISVQNRLSSLCNEIAAKFEKRLSVEKDHPSVELIRVMSKCLNILEIIEKGDGDEDFNMRGEESLKIVIEKAQYSSEEASNIMVEYKIFKNRLYDLDQCDEKYAAVVKNNEHNLYRLHECSSQCSAKYKKSCKDRNKVAEPRMPIPMKFLHFLLREPDLHRGIENFLQLLLRCTMKTHAETVAESMGNLVDLHCEKRRGLGVQDVGLEVFIDWNGPPIHLVDSLGARVLDRYFNGGKWHFVTLVNRAGSVVTRRLKDVKPKTPFF